MRISDWSSDVCSSDLHQRLVVLALHVAGLATGDRGVVVTAGPLHSGALLLPVRQALIAEPVVEVGDLAHPLALGLGELRSEERRVGKECVSTCRSRWSPDH